MNPRLSAQSASSAFYSDPAWDKNFAVNRFLLISIGAVLGANARYLVSLWAAGRFGADFPYGTLIVNVTGSFALGLLAGLLAGRVSLPEELRFLLGIGFLGAYTTFSTFSVETMNMLREESAWYALLNVLANNVGGVIAAFLGLTLARLLG